MYDNPPSVDQRTVCALTDASVKGGSWVLLGIDWTWLHVLSICYLQTTNTIVNSELPTSRHRGLVLRGRGITLIHTMSFQSKFQIYIII